MDDTSKKTDRNKQQSPNDKWQEKLAPTPGQKPTGVSTFTGLLRQSPSDADAYELFQTLDMSSSLHIRKQDVVHLEDLPADKSPFGSLGGNKVYVRLGATITSVRTSTSTFTAGSTAADDFDLDIRLGARRSTGSPVGNQTIPDTGCGPDCDNIPPFTDPDVGGCQVLTQGAICQIQTEGCIPTKAGISICFCAPFTQRCITPGTCQNTCQTCQTQCGVRCQMHTRIAATQCNPRGCVIKP
jgi:hypothetical protein